MTSASCFVHISNLFEAIGEDHHSEALMLRVFMYLCMLVYTGLVESCRLKITTHVAQSLQNGKNIAGVS